MSSSRRAAASAPTSRRAAVSATVRAAAASSRSRSSQPARSSASAGAVRSWRSQSAGSGASTASLTRLTSPATRWWAVSEARRSDVRRSRSQRSTSSNRPVRKSCWSSWWRSSERARRKVWKRPWGSIATWVNWARFMPTRRVTRWPVSSSRVDSVTHSPSIRSAIVTEACSVVVPEPRSLARSHAGERAIRKRRPDRVASSVTRGRVPGAAWSAAQPLGRATVAGHVAVQREADRVEHAGLAGAGRPGQQEQPGVGEVVEVDGDGAGERPERRHLEDVEPHPAPCVRSMSTSGSSAQASHASSSSADSASVAGHAAHLRDEVERDRRGRSDPACARAARTCARRRRRLEAEHQRVGEADAQPLHRLQRAQVVGEGGLHPRVLVLRRAAGRRAARRGCRGAGPARAGPAPRRTQRPLSPSGPRSTSQEPLTWPASEKE